MADFSKFQFQGEDGRDEFQREPIAEKIIQLLTSNIDISPMIIDGDWGTGKSEFCHKLINKFKDEKDGYQIIYIDAFKADHADNPLMTIFAEIVKLVPEKEKESFIKKALPFMRYVTTTTLKATASHILRANLEDIEGDFKEAIQDVTNTAIDTTITTLLKDHEEAEKNLEALQSLLAELAKDKPIIIFIDELDRCRPDFSVSMLEVIKHTFNVENVKFVLVTNTAQLKAAINHAYGSTINAQRYLNKFVKFTISLPTKHGDEYNRKLSSFEYFQQLARKSEVLQETILKTPKEYNATVELIYELINANNLSLREVETFIKHFEIAHILGIQLTDKTKWGYCTLYALGIFIGCFQLELIEDIQTQNVNAEHLFKLVNVNMDENIPLYSFYLGLILLASQAHVNSSVAQQLVEKFQERGNSLENTFFDGWIRLESYWSPLLNVIDLIYLRAK